MDWNLFKWADAQTLRRASAYVKGGAVGRRRVSETGPGMVSIEAEVDEKGGIPAQVRLDWDGRLLKSHCSCPMAAPCRHAVAVALAHQEEEPKTAAPAPIETPAGLYPGKEVLFYNLHLAPPPKKLESQYQRSLCVWIFLEKAIVTQEGLPGLPRPLPMWAPVVRKGLTEADAGILDIIEPYYRAQNRDFVSTQAHGIPLKEEMVGPVFAHLTRCPFVFGAGRAPLSIRPDKPLKNLGGAYEELWEIDGEVIAAQRSRLVGDPPWVLARDEFRPLLEAPAPALVDMPEEVSEVEPPPEAAMIMHAPLAPKARLNLFEEGDRLLVRLSFRYGSAAPIAPADSRMLVGGEWEGTWGFWNRDVEAEQALVERLAKTTLDSRGGGQYLAWGEAALVFLMDEVPHLASEGWDVFGEERLVKLRVNRQRASVSMGIASGIDWFDLKTTIQVDGQSVAWPELRESLKHHSRFVRLGDGSYARLPEEWLARQRQLSETLGYAYEEVEEGFLQKLPRYLAPIAGEMLEAADEGTADRDWRRFLSELSNLEIIDELEPPVGFTGELRHYQKRGLARLRFWSEHGLHGILADDMGLGKTIQAIALLLSEKAAGVSGPSLLVVPTSVVYNWEQEVARFAPELRVLVLHGGERHGRFSDLPDSDVVITTYGLMQRDSARLDKQAFNYVILDEAQKIKNPRSQAAKAACRINARHRLCLTGTPIENNLLEFWSLFHFLMPGLLGSERQFRNQFLKATEEESAESRQHLKRTTRPFILRRLKQEVAQDLPPRSEIVAYCELSTEQRKFYDETLSAVRGSIFNEIEARGWRRARFHVLEGLLRLRQAVCDPRLVLRESENVPPSAKVEQLMEILREIIAEGHRVLVFSQFVKMLTILREQLAEEGIEHAYLDGRTKDRLERVQAFNAGDTPVFLISLKAGGTGLNLTGADYVIHFDPWWNPAVEDQATDRAHRIGQTRHVFSYKLIAKDTIEEKVLSLQEKKRKMVRDVLGAAEGGADLTMEDLEYLLC